MMAGAPEIEQRARAGADSVYSFVERRAEHVPEGVRWQTLTWENEPQYDFSVFWGSGGIPLFLADYSRLTGDTRALDLAIRGAQWCSQPERLSEGSAEEWRNDGLVRGRAGVGMAWLRIAQAAGVDRAAMAQAAAVGDHLLNRTPGPYTDWLDGATGEGIFLLRLAQASGEERFLDGARRWGDWLAGVAIRDQHGLYWPWAVGTDDPPWYGLSFVPGAAGNSHFLLSLYQETQDARLADVAREAGETLRRQAVPDRGGLNWPDTLDGLAQGEPLKAQWCYGAPGVGIFFAKLHEALGDPKDLETAEAAGECTYQHGDVRRNACQCHGLAGNGDLLLDLYQVSGKQVWLDRAHDFARRAFAYRRTKPAGDEWQADDAGFYAPEFMLGASGTGHFFLRLWQRGALTRPLL